MCLLYIRSNVKIALFPVRSQVCIDKAILQAQTSKQQLLHVPKLFSVVLLFLDFFVFSLALLYLVVISFKSYNMELNGKWMFKNIVKETLSTAIFANPRPLYNSNIAKVYILKWSQ